jgi:nitroreductase
MDALHAIHNRRSIRQFHGEPVEDHLVEEVIAAGMMAPSAGNEQPWHFVVLKKRKLLRAISKNHLYASVVEKAPVAILVCGDLALDRYGGYWAADCAAATQNMLIAAHALSLGSLWIGLHPRPQRVADIRAIITLPETVVPFSLVVLGYAAEEKSMEVRFDVSRIHQDQW